MNLLFQCIFCSMLLTLGLTDTFGNTFSRGQFGNLPSIAGPQTLSGIAGQAVGNPSSMIGNYPGMNMLPLGTNNGQNYYPYQGIIGQSQSPITVPSYYPSFTGYDQYPSGVDNYQNTDDGQQDYQNYDGPETGTYQFTNNNIPQSQTPFLQQNTPSMPMSTPYGAFGTSPVSDGLQIVPPIEQYGPPQPVYPSPSNIRPSPLGISINQDGQFVVSSSNNNQQ